MMKNLRAARTLDGSNRARNAERRATEALSKYKIPEDKYLEAIQSSIDMTGGVVHVQTKAQFEKLAHENMGLFFKTLDVLSGFSIAHRRSRKLTERFTGEREILQEREKYMKSVGTILRSTLHPDMRIIMQNYMVHGGSLEKPDDRTVKTLPEYLTVRERAKTEHTPEARKRRFSERLETEALRLGKRPSLFNSDEQKTFNDSFLNTEGLSHGQNKAGGFLAALLGLLFPSRSDMEAETRSWWNTLNTTSPTSATE